MKFFVKSPARNDLRDIAAYIAKDNPKRAVSYIAELNAKIRTIAELPYSYPLREDWGPELRSGVYGSYQIIFTIEDETVIIIRVIHGARNIPDILE
jgi:toxin ParE1/3/4